MAAPLRSADFEIYLERGIDNYGSCVGVIRENTLLKQAGAWYEYVDVETGEVFKFQSKDFIPLMGTNVELREQIYKRICEQTILQYKTDTLDIDNHQVDTEGPGENN